MTNDQWTDRLSEYLDDELDARERGDLEAHLAACETCRATLGELRSVVARAGALGDRAPARDLWPGIEPRLEGSGRRYAFSLPQLVAAGLALMILSGASVWLLRRQAAPPALEVGDGSAGQGLMALPVNLADASYDQAVADLQRALDAGRQSLDPATIRVLEDSLAAIDQAIEQSQRALMADPANTYLYNHLVDARKRKLALLRRASALTTPEG